jgi:hypothetical protein
MVMRMLRAGGVPFSGGAHPYSGEHVSQAAAIAAVRPGTVTKLLDPTMPDYRLPKEAEDWVFLWIDRDLIQQSKSWAKLGAFLGMG